MKKTFLTRRNALLSQATLTPGVLLLGAAILLLLLRLILPGTFFTVLEPALTSSAYLDTLVRESIGTLTTRAELIRQVDRLQEENAYLALQNRALTDTIAATHGFTPTPERLIAAVLARPPVAPYDTLIIDRGAQGGVAQGFFAYAVPSSTSTAAVPVGVVEDVLGTSSRVVLFSTPGSLTAVWVGDAHTPVTLSGAGGGAFRAAAPRAAGVVAGDRVLLQGTGEAIGVVARVDSDPTSPADQLQIAPSINPFSITQVALRDPGTHLPNVFSCASTTTP